MLRNAKGLTAIELMGALAIALLVIGTLIVLLGQSHSSAVRIALRETVQQEAEDSLRHMVSAIRTGFAATAGADYALSLDNAETGEYIRYRRLADGRLTFESSRIPEGADTAVALGATLSHHTESVEVSVAEGRVSIALTMRYEGSRTETFRTVAYTLR
ncbi:hypothetical protein IDH44_23730 [Paenibacillus sp. IB182496]|uniref:Uncharacterized protein n=1 Tax=Paenibacillus sabuli TaxID=2772509 RepID=A0A927BWL4_9BACL|nr:hypothetical protein [Paenibacillus sabuli]MBD2848216.1 hypothetical protein [Paenibacillus sabuli]